MNFLHPDLFFQFLKGCCYGNRFWAKFGNDLYSTLWHFERESIIAISIEKYSMAIFSLHTQVISKLSVFLQVFARGPHYGAERAIC